MQSVELTVNIYISPATINSRTCDFLVHHLVVLSILFLYHLIKRLSTAKDPFNNVRDLLRILSEMSLSGIYSVRPISFSFLLFGQHSRELGTHNTFVCLKSRSIFYFKFLFKQVNASKDCKFIQIYHVDGTRHFLS